MWAGIEAGLNACHAARFPAAFQASSAECPGSIHEGRARYSFEHAFGAFSTIESYRGLCHWRRRGRDRPLATRASNKFLNAALMGGAAHPPS